jgi:hypothetical protein
MGFCQIDGDPSVSNYRYSSGEGGCPVTHLDLRPVTYPGNLLCLQNPECISFSSEVLSSTELGQQNCA